MDDDELPEATVEGAAGRARTGDTVGSGDAAKDEVEDRAEDEDLDEDPDLGRLDGRRDLADERRPGGRARSPMRRIGELIPAAARHLGLEEELRTARARTTWDAIVGERVPAATGESRLVGIDGSDLLVEADTPIVGQELRMRSGDLLAAFRGSPGGFQAAALRIRVRHG